MLRKCPACNAELFVETPLKINQQVVCAKCGQELEVVWLYPLELVKVVSSKNYPALKKQSDGM